MSVQKIHGVDVDVKAIGHSVDKLIQHWKDHSSDSFNRMLHDVRHSTNISSSGKKQIYVGEEEDLKLQLAGESSYILKNRKE